MIGMFLATVLTVADPSQFCSMRLLEVHNYIVGWGRQKVRRVPNGWLISQGGDPVFVPEEDFCAEIPNTEE